MEALTRGRLYISVYSMYENVQAATNSPKLLPSAMRLTKSNMGERRKAGITTVEGLLVALLLVFGTLTLAYVTATMSNSSQISSIQSALVGTQSGVGLNGA